MSRAHPQRAHVDRPRLQSLRRRLLGRAQQPPPADWPPFVIDGARIGTAVPEVAQWLAAQQARCSMRAGALVADLTGLDFAARSALLNEAAVRLRDAGLLRGWRDEQLDVRSAPEAAPLATIERSACRPLGITTVAVHLNAFAADGRLFVARRALHKQIDPGRWDNLVGGMVPAGESELDALVREAHEEAGLDLRRAALTRGGRVHVTRVVPEGYQSEIVQAFDTRLTPTARPHNVDGEVAAIEARDIEAVVAAIGRDEFTLEAALATLDALLRDA